MVLVGWSKRTEVHLIALEAVTELGPVDQEKFPVKWCLQMPSVMGGEQRM